MYVSKYDEETRLAVLHSLIKSHPFATMVLPGKDGLVANHIPLMLIPEIGKLGALQGHIARANPIWKDFSYSTEALILFEGPAAYISPGWYPSKKEHGKVVPTWNYAVVHTYGRPQFIQDSNWLLKHVTTLTDLHELNQEKPWEVSDAPKDYIDNLIGEIIGIEVEISRIFGKWKIGKGRSAMDRLGAAEGLKCQKDSEAELLAELMRKTILERNIE